jgi:hypothetical protein
VISTLTSGTPTSYLKSIVVLVKKLKARREEGSPVVALALWGKNKWESLANKFWGPLLSEGCHAL